MFESHEEQTSRSPVFGKILVVSLFIFAGIMVMFAYLLRPGDREEIDLTGVLREGTPDYEWYEKYVGLREPKVKMGRNFAGKRIVIFSGVIENNGERSLDVVEVELNFFNYHELVWTTTRTPILPGSSTYTPPMEPLEHRGFTLYMENIPEGWLASHAEMEVHGFRFLARP